MVVSEMRNVVLSSIGSIAVRPRRTILIGVFAASIFFGGAFSSFGGVGDPAAPGDETVSAGDETVDFTTQILPILSERCYGCHGERVQMHGLRLDHRQGALKGGESGSPALIPGNSDGSRLVRYVSGADPKIVMPPQGDRLSGIQISLLRAWIDHGAHYSEGTSGHSGPSGHWSFQPLRRPPIPEVQDRDWVRNPIDAFILEKLESRGWKPSASAEPRALLRRMYLDLIGLPPTLQEQARVLAPTPEGFDELASELLQRPGYGERWGRHWLDLVRYAETNGYERDATKPNVWKYRDYVIRSFNQDKPYDRFILEQLAGDELVDSSAETLTATGFTRLGPWDDEPADIDQDRFDQLDDIVRTTSEVFLGITVGCARCHDHKFDPIAQRDYYSMVAVFNGLRRPRATTGRRELDLPIGTREQLDRLSQREAKVAPLAQKIERLREDFRASFLRGGKSSLPEDARQAFLTDREQRSDEQESLVTKHRADLAEEVAAAMPSRVLEEIQILEDEVSTIRATTPDLERAYFMNEPKLPGPTHLLIRGSAATPGAEVDPMVPAVLADPAPTFPAPRATSLRRLTLARWIASRNNPLTARVMVNRVWHFHFGAGLVRTPNDFGAMGQKPTHPELLDWLADWFVEQGWSLKKLHHLILTSNSYRMSKSWQPVYGAEDPENRLLWRFPYTRLEAESIRDSILTVSGRLNRKMYGPSMLPAIQPAALAGHQDPDKIWKASEENEASRRTVYAFIKRLMIIPMLEVLDFCDTSRSSAKRTVTVVAPQALTLFNGDFVTQQSGYFADRLIREVGPDFEQQIDRAYRLALARLPTAREREMMLDFLRREMEAALWESFEMPERTEVRRDALEQMCRVMFNLNEFVYPD